MRRFAIFGTLQFPALVMAFVILAAAGALSAGVGAVMIVALPFSFFLAVVCGGWALARSSR